MFRPSSDVSTVTRRRSRAFPTIGQQDLSCAHHWIKPPELIPWDGLENDDASQFWKGCYSRKTSAMGAGATKNQTTKSEKEGDPQAEYSLSRKRQKNLWLDCSSLQATRQDQGFQLKNICANLIYRKYKVVSLASSAIFVSVTCVIIDRRMIKNEWLQISGSSG